MRAVRRRGPVRRAAAAGLGLAVPGQHVRPGDPGRHPGGPRPAGRCRPDPDRAPGQGPGVGRRRGGGGPGGHLAGPADALVAARHGRAGGRGRGRAVPGTAPTPRPRPLASKLLNEERRLFYVAVTRARRTLVVTASGSDDSQERPSRFLAELAGDEIEIEDVAGAAPRWLSLPALTADLRRAAADPDRPPALRRAAAAQLARLAAAGVRGAHPRQLVPAHRAVRSRAAPRRGGRPAGPAVAVPGRVVPPVRAALAARGRRGRRVLGRDPALRHRSSTRPRCSPPPGADEAMHRRADRRDLASPGLRQPLVQRASSGSGPAAW